MSCIVVCDASCLIDLEKGRLLHFLIQLPFQFVVPLVIRQEELFDFTHQDWQMLADGGMQVYDLLDENIALVQSVGRKYRRLSEPDTIVLATALCHEGCILLTGDSQLRRAAEESEIEAHGALWTFDQLEGIGCERGGLIVALKIWLREKSVFLPDEEIQARLRRLGRVIP